MSRSFRFRRPVRRLLLAALILLGSVVSRADTESASSVAPAGSPLEIRSVRVGIEGFYKNGLWTPIIVEWSGPTPSHTACRFAVHGVDSDGTPIIYRQETDATRHVAEDNGRFVFRETLYAKPGRHTAPLSVEIDAGGASVRQTLVPSGNPIRMRKSESASGPAAKRDRFYEPLAPERTICLIVGNEDIGLQGVIAELSLREDRRPILVKVGSFSELPEHWIGYEAVDMIVLTTTEPKQFEGQTADSPRIRAIDDWIRMGGRLFFCAGKNSEPFLEPENGALRPFLPGKYQGMTDVRENALLEVFVASKRQIVMRGTEDAPFLAMPRFTEPRGIVSLSDRDQPIVLRCAHGLGTVIYFGGDLSGKPLGPWRDRVSFVRKILDWKTDRAVSSPGTTSLIQLGYNDISGQIRSALDRFAGVRIVPFSALLGILIAYWFVVGPVDRVLVLRVLKRPVSTWITFPLWIVLFGVLAYYLAAPGRPNRTLLNELDLVDVDGETGFTRLSSWGNLYSPADRRYSLDMEIRDGVGRRGDRQPSVFSWNGLPGSGLGGMAPKTYSPTVWQTGSEQRLLFPSVGRSNRPATAMDDVPVPVRSTKSFFGQGFMRNPDGASHPTAELTDTEGVPVGRLELPETMPGLDDCLLIYGRWALELGSLEPGRRREIGKTTARREIRELLIPSEVFSNANLKRLASYNTQSTDLPYIVRVLSLHSALGGFESTGLYNSFQRSLDLSDQLPIDRAILIGTVRSSSTEAFGPEIDVESPERTDSNRRETDCVKKRLVVFRQTFPVTPSTDARRFFLKDALDDPDPTIKPPTGQDEYKPDLPRRVSP